MLTEFISVKGIVVCKPFPAPPARKPGELALAQDPGKSLVELQPVFYNDDSSEVPVSPETDTVVVRGSCSKSPWAVQKFTLDGVYIVDDYGIEVTDKDGKQLLQDLILVPVSEIVGVVSNFDDGKDSHAEPPVEVPDGIRIL